MAVRKVSKTDNVTFGDGVTARQGVVADRNVSIGDNSEMDLLLLEDGCFLLQQNNVDRFLRDVLIQDD